ncbi:unnamed protein product [Acanthoscelides obtectus]|uniref:C2H2-type domain-containing protein n=1 Tax=Acanthoscelides obtectus TaxID=200917 RepID=A0A9P0PFU6_ACAOB|nr:unnamed protein product [Acanthoscelides obtectus]CAK1676252.1 Zinc finger protein 26 [Acanthoscelides obtectus]
MLKCPLQSIIRIKVEEKLERGIEADSTADNVDQMEFQESVKLEEKPPMSSTSSEDMNALVLHEEIDIKTESDEIDDLTHDSAQIKKNWERKHRCSQMEEEKKLFSRYVCNYTDRSEMGFKCNMAFKHKASLDDHIVRKHAEYIGSVSSKIHECTFCDFKTVHKNNLTEHMSKHTNANASNLHICEHCNTSFKRKESLFDHILKKHPDFIEAVSNKIYECVHGDFKTTKRASFKTHMAKHDTQRPFECINCDASYKAKQTLYHHIVQKHPELTDSVSCKIYECIQCEYKTTYASELAEHDMQHTGVKLPCIQCNELFPSKRSLDNHVSRKHHVSYNIHQCTHCEYKTTHPRNLTNHMMKHTGAKLTCTKCDASFRNKQLLDDHILQKHPEFTASVSHKIHKCTHCQYKTTYTGLLDRHMLKHTKLRCKNCDKSFTSQRSLDNHILQKHPEFTASVSHKIHECTHCQYKTRYRRLLDRHMMKHTGAKLTCSKCDASFTSKLSLDNHILQKHPEITTSVSRKIHNCTRCEYKTTVKHSLAKHIMKHTGDKLTCTKSDASFTSKLSLDNHTLQKHPEVTDSLSRRGINVHIVSIKLHTEDFCLYT